MMKTADLPLTREWDKTFPKSDKVNHSKVTFVNHFGITLAADMYVPKNAAGKLPAIAVSGPFGACKEQSSGLYAQEMAERGFLTLAFDPSFTGESGGFPRAMHAPDINVEDFQAAVDFLSCSELADPERIGIIGICGWGGMALQTACVDTRIKATVTPPCTICPAWPGTDTSTLPTARRREKRPETPSAPSGRRTIETEAIKERAAWSIRCRRTRPSL